jgi:hypothetical protein
MQATALVRQSVVVGRWSSVVGRRSFLLQLAASFSEELDMKMKISEIKLNSSI